MNGKQYYLGLYLPEEQAARVRDGAVLEEFGEMVKLNFERRKPDARLSM